MPLDTGEVLKLACQKWQESQPLPYFFAQREICHAVIAFSDLGWDTEKTGDDPDSLYSYLKNLESMQDLMWIQGAYRDTEVGLHKQPQCRFRSPLHMSNPLPLNLTHITQRTSKRRRETTLFRPWQFLGARSATFMRRSVVGLGLGLGLGLSGRFLLLGTMGGR